MALSEKGRGFEPLQLSTGTSYLSWAKYADGTVPMLVKSPPT
jgi:hypothetical protein